MALVHLIGVDALAPGASLLLLSCLARLLIYKLLRWLLAKVSCRSCSGEFAITAGWFTRSAAPSRFCDRSDRGPSLIHLSRLCGCRLLGESIALLYCRICLFPRWLNFSLICLSPPEQLLAQAQVLLPHVDLANAGHVAYALNIAELEQLRSQGDLVAQDRVSEQLLVFHGAVLEANLGCLFAPLVELLEQALFCQGCHLQHQSDFNIKIIPPFKSRGKLISKPLQPI